MIVISVFLSACQSHGHNHYPDADHYSTPNGDVEEGEKERLQQNGEASNLALGKVDAGEGELMLSPAQTPQASLRVEGARFVSNHSYKQSDHMSVAYQLNS